MNKIGKLKKWSTVIISMLLYVCFPNVELNAQNLNIKGKVIDTDGNVLPGTAIRIQGSSAGVSTNNDGDYVINNVPRGGILEFILVGYVTQQIKVGGDKTVINAIMQEETESLEEVTVVAFGTQKKESVIGSITTVNPAELKIPSSNLTNALAGNMAGIIAYQRSGEPGRDNADFFVRGITTFGNNTNPLILIDGIELTSTDLARLQPDDIASFSIMKDATATALYGARGANGVILVTTKQGAVGPAKISLRIENSFSMPTRNVEFADPVTFMQLHNEAMLTRDPLATLEYSQEKIDNTAAGKNPLIYPANDWRRLLFKDYAMNQRVNLSVSGGGGVARYYVAGSFSKDNGILNVDKRNNFNSNIDLKSYNLRANVNIDITKTTELIVRLSGNFDDYTGPADPNTTNSVPVGTEIYNMMVRSNPVLFPTFFPVDEEHKHVQHIMFGNRDNRYRNPYAEMVRGYMNESRSQMLAQLELKQDLGFITEGLFIRSLLNLSRLGSFSVNRKFNPFWYQIESYDRVTEKYRLVRTSPETGAGAGTEFLDLTESPKSLESTLYSETVLNYNRTFADKHSVGALLVLTARDHLNANAGSVQLSLPSRNAGLSGRATYAFDSRYYLEFNFGYNGSERFAANHRYGFFPSAGAGWLISNEKFWEPLKKTVSNLKLRYSYGLVGNDRIGNNADRFFYLSQVNMRDANRTAYFGRDMFTPNFLPGISISRYASDEITWETSTKQNYAVEIGLWNKVNIVAEYFTEYRKNILMTREFIPTTMGLTAPVRANVGEASSRGVDASIDYQQSWNKDFWTAARANFTYATSRYEVFEEPEYNEPYRSRVGNSLAQGYGFIAERLFMDDAEAYNSAPQQFGSAYGGGDIKYTDVNRDGQITQADIVPLGNPTTPEIVYGFGFSLGYKGVDVSCFFQGAANESFWISTVDNPNRGTISTAPFQNQTQLLKTYADSHWSEDNQNMYATWPRLSATLNLNNVQQSTWFMRDGSFLRLKQVEIGYTIPGKWQQKLRLNNFRIYVSGSNLLLFSKFKLWDAEMAGNGLGYPIQRVFNIGLNLTFN
ncbi:MAG: TonB-dependent receptor [Prevotellaceae bacterium]|jgi:TonB-linked SusC/RagA family outer membrane protein|nr:TonB-dependent receptor [Prevotellaceae bacterium]